MVKTELSTPVLGLKYDELEKVQIRCFVISTEGRNLFISIAYELKISPFGRNDTKNGLFEFSKYVSQKKFN